MKSLTSYCSVIVVLTMVIGVALPAAAGSPPRADVHPWVLDHTAAGETISLEDFGTGLESIGSHTVQFLFEFPDLGAERWLADKTGIGGIAEVPEVGEFDEVLKRSEVHLYSI